MPGEAAQAVYLPPLDACFAGGSRVISWNTVARALTDPARLGSSHEIRTFLGDELSIQALGACTRASRPPNGHAKADFETRTSAVNTSQSSGSGYDINQIKEDAQWLSKNAKIDEITALRTCVIRWQDLSRLRLLNQTSEEEVINVQRATFSSGELEPSGLNKSAMARATEQNKLTAQETSENSTARRRFGILRTWYKEQANMLEVRSLLARSRLPPTGRERMLLDESQANKTQQWMETFNTRLCKLADPRDEYSEPALATLTQLLDTLRARGEALQAPDSSLSDELELSSGEHIQSQLIEEILGLLRLALVLNYTTAELPSPLLVSGWFQLLDEFGFCQGLESQNPKTQLTINRVQGLVSLLLLELLDGETTVRVIVDSISDPVGHARHYINDIGCVTNISRAMTSAMAFEAFIAGPAMILWSVIGRELFINAGPEDSMDGIERRDSLTAFSHPGGANSGSAPSGSVRIWQAYSATSEFVANPAEQFAQTSLNVFNVFEEIAKLALLPGDILGPRLENDTLTYEIRHRLLRLVHQASSLSSYTEAAVEALVAIVEGSSETRGVRSSAPPSWVSQQLANDLLLDEWLMQRFVSNARLRYPYEMTPLLSICQTLCASDQLDPNGLPCIVNFLTEVPTFTDTIPQNFAGFESTREVEQENLFILRQDLPIFGQPQRSKGSFRFGQSNALTLFNDASNLTIRRGAEGAALSKEKQMIISWDFEHSALRYFGRWLFEAQSGRRVPHVDGETTNSVSSQIVSLFAKLLDLAWTTGELSSVEFVLRDASEALPRDADLVTLIANIFESAVNTTLRQDDTDTVSLLASCLAFFAASLRAIPGRIWPILSRSGLFEADRNNGRVLSTINSLGRAVTAPLFFANLFRLTESLVDDLLRNSMARMKIEKTTAHRFKETASVDPGITIKQLSSTFRSFARLTLISFRNLEETSFEHPMQRFEVAASGIQTLSRLAELPVNDELESRALSAILKPAFSDVYDLAYRQSSSESLVAQIVAQIRPLALTPPDLMDAQTLEPLRGLVRHSLHLLNTLLQQAKNKAAPPVGMLQILVATVPIFIRIYSAFASLRTVAISVLTSLAEAVGNMGDTAPSIFAQLGPDIAQDAVKTLSDIDSSADDPELTLRLWKFFSACVCNRQTWFTGYLLTGKTPSKGQLHATSTSGTLSVFDIALELLSNSDSFGTPVLVAVLQFIADSLNHRIWSINKLRAHKNFLSRITDQLGELQWEPDNASTKQVMSLAWHTAGAGLVCEILAMYFHARRLTGNDSTLKDWATKIPLLEQSGFKDPAYNFNLHERLERNFEQKFTGMKPSSLVRQTVTTEYGPDFYYDLKLGTALLDSFPAWSGSEGRPGFQREFELANTNLSLVDAQRRMIIRWKLLCLELTKDANASDVLLKKLAYVVHECLDANNQSDERSEGMFSDLKMLRMDLATTITQSLVERRYLGQPMHTLLSKAWTVTRASKPDFEAPFTSSGKEYYRLCVRQLLSCVRSCSYIDIGETSLRYSAPVEEGEELERPKAIEATNDLSEIATNVIAEGFRSLCAQLHEDAASVLPNDFMLLTSLLQALLQVRRPHGTNLHAQLAQKLGDYRLGRYATALFSWSDQLRLNGVDPLYGEISIAFLVEMSALPSLAENLATDGVLSRLNAASLMSSYAQPDGVRPFEEPARLYKIWARGVLPLVLNVLVAVGAPFAAEAATFLNNYSPQLEIASNVLDNKGAPTLRNQYSGTVTLNSASEAHTLALIALLLDQYRSADDADIPELKWDRGAVKDDIETWTSGTRSFLRERIVPYDDKEIALSRMQPIGKDKKLCGCKSRLEELVLKELKGAAFVLG